MQTHFLRIFTMRVGQIISDFDILLAATALHYDLTVLTRNTRHLNRISTLKIYRPKA
jgi:predicted nucleic acid-binding protein